MNKILKMLIVGSLFLVSSALWALGSYIAWPAHKVLLAAIALALISLAIY